MSEVALTIGGRVYRVACAAGEEEHIAGLGAVINQKLAAMGNLSGHDAQNLLFAALLLADELHEGSDKVVQAGDELVAAEALTGSAAGEIEELKAALGNRDSEFAQLQAAQRDALARAESAAAQVAELDQRLADSHAHQAALQQRIEQLTHDLAERPEPGAAATAEQADLAPALERLAEMLEQTADKLERRAAAP